MCQCSCSLFPSLHQRLAEVLLGVAVLWTLLQGQFKVCDGLHDAAFVSIPEDGMNESTDVAEKGLERPDTCS